MATELGHTAGHRHYDRSPIIEAVVDFRIDEAAPEHLKILREAAAPLKSGFPRHETIHVHEVRADLSEGGDTVRSDRQRGIRLINPDGTRIIQFRLDGYNLAHLSPYETWRELERDSREHWATYVRALQPSSVTRIAVRYINRIDLPLPIKEVRDFLPLVPDFPDGMPRELNGFFLQLTVVPRQPEGSGVTVNHALMQPLKDGHASFLLDIDAFLMERLDIEDEAIWSRVASLHEVAYDVFESCITDQVRERIR